MMEIDDEVPLCGDCVVDERVVEGEVSGPKTPVKKVNRKASVLQGTSQRTTDTRTMLMDTLAVNSPMLFDSLILDSLSFAKTVDNLSHLSSMVKDGYASVYLHNEFDLYVGFMTPPNRAPTSSATDMDGHFIYRLDYSRWKEMVQSKDDRTRP